MSDLPPSWHGRYILSTSAFLLASISYTVASWSFCQGPVSHPVSNHWLHSCRGLLGLLVYWWLLSWFFSYTLSWSWPSFCGVGPILPPPFAGICMFQFGPGPVWLGCHSVGFPQLKLSCLPWMMPLHTCPIQIPSWCHLIHFSLCWLAQLVVCHWFHTASGHLHRTGGWYHLFI